jgi:capsular exopolysaccharide synthesis family protein
LLASASWEANNQAISLVGARRQLEILENEEATERLLRDRLIEKIAQIDLTRDQGNIRTRVTDMPKVVKTHVWPRLSLVGLFALTAGLAVGVAIVSVLDVLDDRFRSPEELQSQLGLPVLALVRQLTPHAESGPKALQMHVAPDASESEAFRTLRTAIAFSGQESDRIVVSSAEPGDGKTTILANLAVTYARAGKRTLIIDADMRRPGLTKLVECQGQHGLTQLLQGSDPVAEMASNLVRPTGIDQLEVLPSGPRQANPAELLAGPRLPELLAWAESVYDQVMIDAPPAAAAVDASIIGAIADGLILVVRPEKNKRQAVVRAVDGFRGMGLQPRGVVVNGLGAESHGYYPYDEGYGYGTSEPETDPRFSVHPVGTVAENDAYASEPAPAPIVPRRAA